MLSGLNFGRLYEATTSAWSAMPKQQRELMQRTEGYGASAVERPERRHLGTITSNFRSMTMYKKILVPTDGSDTATAGLREAIKLAKEQGAQIRIIHVVDELVAVSPYIYGAVFQQMLDQLRANGESVIGSATALVDKAGISVDAILVKTLGTCAGEHIVEAAKEWRADLLVCGTHGRRGVGRIVMGSDAEYIVRRSPVPILWVRAAAPETQTRVSVDSAVARSAA